MRWGRAGHGAGEKRAKLDFPEEAMPDTNNSLTLNDQIHQGSRSKDAYLLKQLFFFFPVLTPKCWCQGTGKPEKLEMLLSLKFLNCLLHV